MAADGGYTALHLSAQDGHLAVTVDLVKAGADLDAKTLQGDTPLHLAAGEGQAGATAALIEAGADVDSRSRDGRTPLYMAASKLHLNAVTELLRAKANPLSAMKDPDGTNYATRLDMTVHNGHLKVVRELIHKVGIESCGGKSGSVAALCIAVGKRRVDIMAILAYMLEWPIRG